MLNATKKKKKTYFLLKHQTDFINDLSHATVGLVGGFRAGKTYAAVHKAIKLAFLNKGLNGALMEPTQGMIRGTLMPVINKVLKEDLKWEARNKSNPRGQYTYVKSNPESIVIHFPVGDTIIYLCGAENYDRLAGKTLAWFGIDEIDRCTSKEVAIAAFKEATARLTNGGCVQGFVTSTPEGFHFLHHYFVEQEKDEDGNLNTDRFLHRAKTQDNPYIPNRYIVAIRKNYTPKQAEAYLNGEFVNLISGNVYHVFARDLNRTTKTVADFPGQQAHVGLDFNWGNMNATISFIDELRDEMHVVQEITGARDTQHMIQLLIEALPEQMAVVRQGYQAINIYPDTNGKNPHAGGGLTSMAQLQLAFGPESCHYNGNNPGVLDERVPSMNALLWNGSRRRLLINITRCPLTVKGLEQQGFDPNTNAPDKRGGLDHCMDALGYSVHWLYPIKSQEQILELM
jgi:hypothetical protein